ncbi:MAG: methionyl-tRNA formyltransferase [Anaerolineaceae bacterium]|jgi:methionyl-tRNA formyltransferase|nr:methionyl-tRNA formyltransferase [Anaerolineaceae bacterium]
MNLRVVFMGSPDFAVPILQSLTDHFQVVGVVTQPDRPSGRGRSFAAPPVKDLALSLGLPVIQPERLKEPGAFEQLQAWAPEVIVVAAFGQILRRNVLELPLHGCINVHASLLPRWRGAAPIQAAIYHGDPHTGVTIMQMDAGIDTGAILTQRTVEILPQDTAESLSARLSVQGAALLVETLPAYLSGAVRPVPQEDGLATYVSMLKKEDGLLDLTRRAVELERQVRAFHPWPGAYTLWQGEILKVHQSHVIPGAASVPGAREIIDHLPALGTAEGWLALDLLQPAGKKAMPGKAFLSGARSWREAGQSTAPHS